MDCWIANLDMSDRDRTQLSDLDQNGLGDRDDFFAAFESMTGADIDQNRFAVSLARCIRNELGLMTALKQLKLNHRLAILTNGGVDTQTIKLQALTLDQIIESDRIFISAQIGVAKPDRAAFEFVANALGLPATECLYFGDQLETDVMAARAAGWRACQVSGPDDLQRQLTPWLEGAAC
ncbi:Pyrimidine 5'-nucleotidase YjjG [Stieleria neptunia]|uniref:Pyrimidine 5'-nucleotidase YjjG n=2 Tax=Stieleria neptunia TaxID=2527979 RepID=A0A518HUI8_9BACT|nr:Pyrimidine 5'-nucleotidase YjjG [Stieleria neptunia]